MRNGKRGSANGKERARDRIEPSRMEEEGRFEKQADFCGRRGTEMEDCWSNDSVYLLPLCCRKETEKGGRWEEAKRGRRCHAGAHLLLAHNRWEGETTSKKTGGGTKGRRKTGTSTRVVRGKKGRAK